MHSYSCFRSCILVPDVGPYGLKHVAFIGDIIKILCLTVIYVYANIDMSHHSGMDYVKMNNNNTLGAGRIRFTVRLNVLCDYQPSFFQKEK